MTVPASLVSLADRSRIERELARGTEPRYQKLLERTGVKGRRKVKP